MIEKLCKYCLHFILGTEEHRDKESGVNERDADVDRCEKTHYKIGKDWFCITDEFEEK